MEAVSKIQTNSAESHKAGNNVDKQASPEAPKDATALPTNQSPIAPDPLKASITTTHTTTSNTTTPPATLSNNTTKVLNLSGELYTKHPLEHVWVLWYFKQEKGKEWVKGQKVVASVDTAEDFWALYNYIQPASRINIGCDYSFFKEGISPKWEDPVNKYGGRWIINMDKRVRDVELDQLWLEALLALVGEAFDDYFDEICGLVVNIRGKADKLALWTRNCKPIEVTMEIGKIFKKRLQISKEVCIDYQSHAATAHKTGADHKLLYQL